MLTRLMTAVAVTLTLALPNVAAAQMTYRLKGTVKDHDGKAVAGAKVRAEAIAGFRGEQFVGQKEFETTTGATGEWTILGLTSGLWVFEASAPEAVPQAIVLPINFTNRQPQSAAGGSFSWNLPMTVRRTAHTHLNAAALAAVARRVDEAVANVGLSAAETDADLLCSAGEVALFVRQHGLARAVFEQAKKQNAKHGCATRGLASAALMQNDLDSAAKMLWNAIDLLPREQRPAYGAALKDLQQITGTK
jgi:hypothetical protein